MSASPTHHGGEPVSPSSAFPLHHCDDALSPPSPTPPYPQIPPPSSLPLPPQHLEPENHSLFVTEQEQVTIRTVTDSSPKLQDPSDKGETCKSNKDGGVDNEDNDTCSRRPRRPVSYPCGPESEVQPLSKVELVAGFEASSKRNSYPQKLSAATKNRTQVKPFTKESLEKLQRKTVQLVREYGFQPRRKLSVEDGSRLPTKFEPFPPKLYGRPLEEIDNFIYDEHTVKEAKRLGLRGWCMNTAQKTVKGVIEGNPSKVKDMQIWLQKTGSPASRIEKAVFMNEKYLDNSSYDNFSIKY